MLAHIGAFVLPLFITILTLLVVLGAWLMVGAWKELTRTHRVVFIWVLVIYAMGDYLLVLGWLRCIH